MATNKLRSTSPAPAAASATSVTDAPTPSPRSATRTPLERFAIRMARWVGSLHVAVIAMLILVAVLTIGTMVESYYTGKLAQELVYRTWWFNLLMGVLFLNILFAALKKIPWKRHQTGFVITHIGLLLLIVGGVVNSFTGTDALMALVSEENEQAARQGVLQESNLAKDPDQSFLEVRWPKRYGSEVRGYDFHPGTISWRSDEFFRLKLDPMLNVLSWMAHPIPKSWSVDLGHGATLEVLNFYSHANLNSYRAVKDDSKIPDMAGPAISLELKNPRIGEKLTAWLGTDTARSMFQSVQDIALVQMASKALLSPAQLREFQNPPEVGTAGNCGQLVLIWNNEPIRIPVATVLGQPAFPIGNSGWAVKVNGYYAESRSGDGPYDLATELKKTPFNPEVALEFVPPTPNSPAIAAKISSRLNGQFSNLQGRSLPAELQAWYHAPDYRYGYDQFRAVLDLAITQDGKVFYRSFNSGTKAVDGAAPAAGEAPPLGPMMTQGKFSFEKTGEIIGNAPVVIWGAMQWQLRIPTFYKLAMPSIAPENKRPGLDHPQYNAAILCRLTLGKDSKTFTVGKPKYGRAFENIEVGGERLQIAFSEKSIELPFAIKLLRAEETSDPGTRSAASYSSFVQINDTRNKAFEESHITMNQPLEYGGYKIFQTGMDIDRLPPNPDTAKPVAISTFTVSNDPGLFLKYLGSIFLALGIATMFYMKAYFVKPRTRTPVAA
ncbi:cytochrome c biogenesis protein ResB [Tuwongella immobilis]|uniref:ResB-like domain-containing protein n=1 Tax=Tuwongella immobilis TaxID=692036 RepID=A0A6C2YUG2_9BACT|nr:cytochrome c biogenesis protein ResB [Tuwongella immobilis]VIP04555.1 Putative cytochrome c biogenesis protein OS=Blastopirellula marina DSM 3645 GN=DSM3645_21839 PE=4 SV=1: ResB [Tuwongella immobilis]VTS06471.1 Putative cytochrome c biogenesis protein OS=Blastopirellula marina DSM 3645 GN=DSM3645_21839 PE=4 SV=1: ResB [Tuwongella immobilis]